MQEVGAGSVGNTGEKLQNSKDGEEDDETLIEAFVNGQVIVVDKRDESRIINNECKRIMQNLCNAQMGRGTFQQSGAANVTQPSFLSQEDRVIFFKTKMFYLLQERHCYLKQSANAKQQLNDKGNRTMTVAEAYAPFLSPFCDSAPGSDTRASGLGVKTRRRRGTDILRAAPGVTWMAAEPTMKAMNRVRGKPVMNLQRTGMSRFLENIRKADQSALYMLDEKILKTIEGAGFAALLGNRDVKKADVIMSLFPDYNLLLLDGKDEESKLNNLVSHVRTRMKVFDKMQSFYENPNDADHTAHVFTVPNLDAAEVREELASLQPKELHQLDEKKMLRLYSRFKDDYGSAKTTLIADGTQPIVLNRKKLDRVKRYVDECEDWKGYMLVPYVRETNFFFLMFPWARLPDSARKADDFGAPSIW